MAKLCPALSWTVCKNRPLWAACPSTDTVVSAGAATSTATGSVPQRVT
jgi:hypothetical protein